MKKLTAIILALAFVLLMCACGGGASDSGESQTPENETQENVPQEDPAPELTATGFIYAAPDGWIEDSEDPGMLCAPEYPSDSSNIVFQEGERDEFFDTYTQTMLELSLNQGFTEAFGEEITIDVSAFEKIELEGYPGYMMKYSFTVQGIYMEQTVYMYNADKLYTVNFTQVGDADWQAVFDACADSFAFVYGE